VFWSEYCFLGSPIAAALAVPIVFGVLLVIQGAGLIFWRFASGSESFAQAQD
jgi:uncharacterized membrane protein HdeD (DUF308 family)